MGVVNREFLVIFEINIKGIWNILEVCCRIGCVSRVIVVFSDKVYGD